MRKGIGGSSAVVTIIIIRIRRNIIQLIRGNNDWCRLELLVGNLEQKIGYTTCAEPLRVIDRVVVFGSQGQETYTACSLLRASPPLATVRFPLRSYIVWPLRLRLLRLSPATASPSPLPRPLRLPAAIIAARGHNRWGD